MRLTLRTLLAYLDDLLDPKRAQEIAQKTTESSFASTLINRIREVMRRRRLAAPELNGPASGLDPNTVAEYLDNTLPTDNVADVEKVCLESDVHLAEVAACHQVLTLVLGESVDVTPHSRERMYALGPVSRNNGDQPRTATEKQSAAEPQRKTQRGFQDSIPSYLQPAPLWRRVFPFAFVGIAVSVWIASFYFEPMFFPNNDETSNSTEVAGSSSADSMDNSVVETDDTGNNLIADAKPTVDGQPTLPGPRGETKLRQRPSVPEGINVDPPPDDVEPVVATPTDDNSKTTLPRVPPIEPTPVDPGPPAKNTSTPNEVEIVDPPKRAPEIQYTSVNGILLRQDAKNNDWFVMPRRAMVHQNELIAVPEPFKALVTIDSGRIHGSLRGGTVLKILGPTAKSILGLDVSEGRLSLEAKTGEGAPGIVLGLVLYGETMTVELLTGETVCGIDISRRQPEKFEHDLGQLRYSGGLYVVKGSVRLTDDKGIAQIIDGGDWMPLTPEDRAAILDPENPRPKLPLLQIPQWLDKEAKRPTLTARKHASLFEKEFNPEQSVSMSIPAVIKSNRPSISELAVKCLALTQSYESLVQTLAQGEFEEARRAALIGLRTWLPTNPDNGKRLTTVLMNYFVKTDSEAIYQLLWGFDEKSARTKADSYQLVEWLEHDEIAIRELAYYHIYRLTGKKNDFRANAPPVNRQAAVNRWLTHLKKEGALLPNN